MQNGKNISFFYIIFCLSVKKCSGSADQIFHTKREIKKIPCRNISDRE